jgi:hypothetical protein
MSFEYLFGFVVFQSTYYDSLGILEIYRYIFRGLKLYHGIIF